MKLSFAIWGAGIRGRRIRKVLGGRAKVFIDASPDKVGRIIDGLPVVDFEEYKKMYNGYFIVVTPIYDDRLITEHLRKNNIYWYSSLNDEPMELIANLQIDFQKLRLERFTKNKYIGIYGFSIWSVLLYEYLYRAGWDNVCIIPEDEKKCCKLEEYITACGYTIHTDAILLDRILMACRNIGEAAALFPNVIIDDYWEIFPKQDSYSHSDLINFKGVFTGKRIFVVGTGPSLTFDDLEMLRVNKELSMSVNLIFRAFDRIKWRPDFYFCGDPHALENYGDEIIAAEMGDLFISSQAESFWGKNSDRISGNRLHRVNILTDYSPKLMRVSDDIVRGCYNSGTCVHCALQIAMYMGFNEIYLLGLDSDYGGNGSKHFIANYYHDEQSEKKDVDTLVIFGREYVFRAYQSIRYYAEQHGIKIYNATRGGKLEVFERVNFDTLFESR